MDKESRYYYIETFGCQMNRGDSELMALSLEKAGFSRAPVDVEADVVIFNTCSVREHAENRVITRIRSVKNTFRENAVIVIAGCMAQRLGKKLLDDGLADIAAGPYESPRIGDIVNEYSHSKKKAVFDSQDLEDFSSRFDPGLAARKDHNPWHKWVTITHGCGNYCSYCIVPYVRGRLISFPEKSIIEYAENLAENGVNEITLLGQNVNQYGENGGIPFYKLLERIASIRGLEKINFLTSHPKDFDDHIIYVMRDNGNISRGIHLPLQSGSDSVLKSMNRNYTSGHYMRIIEKISSILGCLSVSTDIIVGFPGETEADFNSTLDMLREIKFDDAFMYAYSPRKGTAAYNLEETISKEVKSERLDTLIRIQRDLSREKLMRRINCFEDMIPERISRRSGSEIMGRTFLNHPVVAPGSADDIGRHIRIKITGLKGSTLCAERID